MPLPKPLKREKETSFIGRCVPLVLEQEGLDKDDEKQRKIAVAICYGLWRKAKGGKTMEIEDLAGLSFDVDGEEVIFEDLIEAYKVREDVKDDGEREKAKKAQKARSKKHGIAVLDHGNITKPSEWAALSDAQFGDPVNYRYPIHDKAHASNARSRFAQEDFTYKGRGKVGDRIEKAAKKFKIGEFADKSLDELDEGKSLSFGERTRLVRRALDRVARPSAITAPKEVSDYWIDSDDIYDDYVIVKCGDKEAYKVSYTMDEDNNVEFAAQDKWEKVEREWVPSKAMDYCVKRLGETDTAWCIGSYGLYWGSPEKRDLSPWQNKDGSKGEFFTLQTQGLDDLPIKVITFEHDKEKGPEPECEPIRHSMGTTILERDDAIGRWIEAHIEKRRKYATYVMDLVDRNELSFSSETAGHWRDVADNGEIKHWRTAGYTLTTHPMEPRLTDVEHLRAYYKSLDMDLAEPDMGGAPEDGGLEMEKAKAKARILLSRIRKGEVKEL